jgi:hypothetical protein
MSAKKSPKVSRAIVAKAREILAFAEQRAREGVNATELSNALFSPTGKATLAFPTEPERRAFSRTKEYKTVLALLAALPRPAATEIIDLATPANGEITVRLPRSVHAALLDEAKAEGVSLDQLCVSKLVAQLRAVLPGKPAGAN